MLPNREASLVRVGEGARENVQLGDIQTAV